VEATIAEDRIEGGSEETGRDSLEVVSLPEFPPEAFTGLFKEYRDLVEPCTEAPASYHWVTFLTMIGLLLGRLVFIRVPFPLYANFYSLLIGPTGVNRKSTSMDLGVREIIRKLPNDIRIITGALSSEGIYEELAKRDGSKLLLYCDEMRSFLNVANRQATTDIIPRLNTLYGCPDVDGLTRRRDSIEIKLPFVSFIAGTPKEWLTSAVGTGAIMGGFVNRFLLVDGKSMKDIAFPMPPNEQAAQTLITKLSRIVDECSTTPIEMTWSEGAKSIYDTFYCSWRERQRGRDDETAAITNRITHHIVKIGMVYSVLDGQTEITDCAIATAIEIGRYLEETALAIFGDTFTSAQGRTEKMIITRLENNDKCMGLRELKLNIGSKADTQQFNTALMNLEKAEVVRIVPTKHGKMVVLLA
jgi:hypothetical protein